MCGSLVKTVSHFSFVFISFQVLFIYLFIYLFIITQQKDQMSLTLSVKAHEAKSTCNTQSTKHSEIDQKK